MAKTTTIKAKAMTTREFLSAILDDNMGFVSSNGQTVLEKATEMRDAIDKRNAAAKEKPRAAKSKVDNSEEKALILEHLETLGESAVAKDIAEALDMTTQKATAVIRQMVAEGTVERIEISRSKPLQYRKA